MVCVALSVCGLVNDSLGHLYCVLEWRACVEREKEEKKEPELQNKSILLAAKISVAFVCLFDSLFSLWLLCFLCGCIRNSKVSYTRIVFDCAYTRIYFQLESNCIDGAEIQTGLFCFCHFNLIRQRDLQAARE